MTVDERLEFLLTSTESLHSTVAEMSERMEKEHAAHRAEMVRHHRAILSAIRAYIETMTDGQGEEPGSAS